ncbi:MAG: DUF11 domain-containing protein, partial [Deltaproteobacteria bacterium]
MNARQTAHGTALAIVLLTGVASAQTGPRRIVDVTGDFGIIGNVLGRHCADVAPLVGDVMGCVERNSFPDVSPDLYWRSETSSAAADVSVTPDRMRSTAVLEMPSGARLLHAYLYWWANTLDTDADVEVTVDRPGAAPFTATATASHTFVQVNDNAVMPIYATTLHYLAVADVTGIVAAYGDGPYRIADLSAHPLDDVFNLSQAGWALVVVYARDGDPPRHVALYDGIERIVASAVEIELDGLIVPNAGFDGKLAIVGLDGEVNGAQLRFGQSPLGPGDAISNAVNPINRFFNGTRSYFGVAQSVVGDLPQASGMPNSFAGTDIDVVDITSRLSPGQTSATAGIAAGPNDGIESLVWVASISTYKPDLEDAAKTVVDENGGVFEVGDVVEYTVTFTNNGNDRALDVTLTDALEPGLTYVPESMTVTSTAFSGPATDAAGDDPAAYDASSRTLSLALATLDVGASATLTFRATLDQPGPISNQATIGARGEGGA